MRVLHVFNECAVISEGRLWDVRCAAAERARRSVSVKKIVQNCACRPDAAVGRHSSKLEKPRARLHVKIGGGRGRTNIHIPMPRQWKQAATAVRWCIACVMPGRWFKYTSPLVLGTCMIAMPCTELLNGKGHCRRGALCWRE